MVLKRNTINVVRLFYLLVSAASSLEKVLDKYSGGFSIDATQ